jgi:hypothetical protein
LVYLLFGAFCLSVFTRQAHRQFLLGSCLSFLSYRHRFLYLSVHFCFSTSFILDLNIFTVFTFHFAHIQLSAS